MRDFSSVCIGTMPLRCVWLSSVCAVAVSAAFGQSPRENETLSDGPVGQQIVETIIEAAEVKGFSGAVLAAKDGKVIAAVGVGHADLAGEHPITPATLLEIASATKQFTAAAIMRLVEQGKVKLDDSIALHLPGVPENCKAITIEHLLRHTSGIPGTNSQGGHEPLEKALPMFLRGGPVHEPGTNFEYWNQGYALLSEIISRASGKDYTAYCKEFLFKPAGMKVTMFTGDEAPQDMTVAVGRSSRGAPRSALEHPYGSYGLQYRGMGGAVTNVWDLWRWDRTLSGDDVLSAESKAKLFEPGLQDYALGWFVKKNASGRLVQSHGGGVRGFACEIRRYPNDDAFLAVLCCRDDVQLPGIVRSLEETLFSDPQTTTSKLRALDPALAAAISGRFKDDRGDVLTVKFEKPITKAQIQWGSSSGPVTHAVLGLNRDGRIMLNDGHDLIDVKVDREGDKPATTLMILGRTFRRTDA